MKKMNRRAALKTGAAVGLTGLLQACGGSGDGVGVDQGLAAAPEEIEGESIGAVDVAPGEIATNPMTPVGDKRFTFAVISVVD